MVFMPAEDLNPVSSNMPKYRKFSGFVSKRPREELVSCSVEVLHGWGLLSLLRPPSRLGGSVFPRPNGWELHLHRELRYGDHLHAFARRSCDSAHTLLSHISPYQTNSHPSVFRFQSRTTVWMMAPFTQPHWGKTIFLTQAKIRTCLMLCDTFKVLICNRTILPLNSKSLHCARVKEACFIL